MAVLYVVATPIGNLQDLSPRGAETLRNADLIIAEDVISGVGAILLSAPTMTLSTATATSLHVTSTTFMTCWRVSPLSTSLS